MRSQFISVLQAFCQRRSSENSDIKWWFTDRAANPFRVASRAGSDFGDEHTMPYGRDADVETLEDEPLEDEFFHSIGYA